MSTRWYAAATQPASEMYAMENLINQAYEAFLPLVSRTVKRRRRLISETIALFPGYIFIKFDQEIDRWRSINGTRGIRRLLTTNAETPMAIEPGVIERLILQSRNGGFEEIAGTIVRNFKPGSKLQITDGPFKDQEGHCIEADILNVTVFLSLLGREVRVSVPVSYVSSAA